MNSGKSRLNIETNFSFMKDIELYEKSDIYKRICENARFAEGAYYINSDICNFYTRKTLELVCKFLEVFNNLSIHTKYNSEKKTIGTYLLYENYFEFLPAIGGVANYELLKKLNEGINPSVHEDYVAKENKIELYDVITGLFQLMVWLYRDLGGKRNILKSDFDERKIPEEFDISFFFKNNDVNINVSERDKRYLQVLQRKKESEIKISKNSEGVSIEETLTGKNEFFVSENKYNTAKKEYKNTVEQYEKKIEKISAEISDLRKNYADNERKWFDEKERIVNEIRKNEEMLGEMHNADEEKKKIIAQLRTQLDAEEEKHKRIIKSYTEYFSKINRDINTLKLECEKYRSQNEYLETIAVEYENLKAEYSAIKYQITTETQYLSVPSRINQIVTDDYFSGMEQLRIYLLRLKDYYDEKEEKYNEEIRRIKEERDDFKAKYEKEKEERKITNVITHNTVKRTKKKKKAKYFLLVSLNFGVALLVLVGVIQYINRKVDSNEEAGEEFNQVAEVNENIHAQENDIIEDTYNADEPFDEETSEMEILPETEQSTLQNETLESDVNDDAYLNELKEEKEKRDRKRDSIPSSISEMINMNEGLKRFILEDGYLHLYDSRFTGIEYLGTAYINSIYEAKIYISEEYPWAEFIYCSPDVLNYYNKVAFFVKPEVISSRLNFDSTIGEVMDVLGETPALIHDDYCKSDFCRSDKGGNILDYQWIYHEGDYVIYITFYVSDKIIADYVEVSFKYRYNERMNE